MKLNFLVLVLSLDAFGLACKSSAPAADNAGQATTAAKSEPASTAKPITAAVKPGSYEDWCDEHQVPESLCTKCNPSLVAAFKATGDWCDEHGVPESQCRLCNPGLKIDRPPRVGAPN